MYVEVISQSTGHSDAQQDASSEVPYMHVQRSRAYPQCFWNRIGPTQNHRRSHLEDVLVLGVIEELISFHHVGEPHDAVVP